MKHNFKNVNNPLKSILTKYHLEEPYTENYIINNWSGIIDKSLVDVIKPVSLKNNTLTLKILNTTWNAELESRKKALTEKINCKLDSYRIHDINLINENR